MTRSLVVLFLAIGAAIATAGEAKLLPEGASPGAGFGTSVAMTGELLAVGAPGNQGGSVHVYAADGRHWRLTPNEPPIISSFGRSVALDGNLIVVGAPSEGAGAFYIFRFDGIDWAQEFKVKSGSSAGNGILAFGTGVAVSGNRVLVSAPSRVYDDRNEGTGLGAFYRHDGTGWAWETTVVTNARNDAFGRSVALEGSTAVVAGNQKLRIYALDGSGWQMQAQITNRGGWSVALEGDVLLSGAPGDSTQGNAAGAVYQFTRTPTGWLEAAKLVPPTRATGARFGTSVALSGDLLVAGAPKHSQGPNEHRFAGAAFAFRRQISGWTLEASLFASDAKDNPRSDELAVGLGASVTAGNGAVLAGAPQDDQLGVAVGAVYIFTEPWPIPPSPGNGGGTGGGPPNGGDGPPPGEGPPANRGGR